VGTRRLATPAVLFEQATIYLALGMNDRAVGSLRAASDIRGPAPEDEKDRLMYLMNLSDALGVAGKLDEALEVAERTLEERERFYGTEHPGYAYGLGKVADVSIALGRYDRALETARKALPIYDASGHHELPPTWARLFLASLGSKASWQRLQMPPDMANDVLGALTWRTLARRFRPSSAPAVGLVAPFASDADALVRAWNGVQHTARKAKDYASRKTALERMHELAETERRMGLVLETELGLALCHEEAGEQDEARRGYERALETARRLASPDPLCKTLRNVGLYYIEREPDRGMALLREAARTAQASAVELARSRMALGIKLQHLGELAEARETLTQGLTGIDPAEPDAICARSHLRAIEGTRELRLRRDRQGVRGAAREDHPREAPARSGPSDRIRAGRRGVHPRVARPRRGRRASTRRHGEPRHDRNAPAHQGHLRADSLRSDPD
jgi:tetratricopeptide (TPR) repeat protein